MNSYFQGVKNRWVIKGHNFVLDVFLTLRTFMNFVWQVQLQLPWYCRVRWTRTELRTKERCFLGRVTWKKQKQGHRSICRGYPTMPQNAMWTLRQRGKFPRVKQTRGIVCLRQAWKASSVRSGRLLLRPLFYELHMKRIRMEINQLSCRRWVREVQGKIMRREARVKRGYRCHGVISSFCIHLLNQLHIFDNAMFQICREIINHVWGQPEEWLVVSYETLESMFVWSAWKLQAKPERVSTLLPTLILVWRRPQ